MPPPLRALPEQCARAHDTPIGTVLAPPWRSRRPGSPRADPRMLGAAYTGAAGWVTLIRTIFFLCSRSWAIGLALVPLVASASDQDAEQTAAAIVVTATRRPTLIQDEPLRVEAVPAEEIEENLTIQPGNLSSLLREL